MSKPYAWDRGLDYEQTYKLILKHFRETNRDTSKENDIILLTQLRNGCRVSEAINFLKAIVNDFKREMYINVMKRKDGYERLIVLPEEISKKDVLRVKYVIEKANKHKVAMYCKRTYGFNTHSLRYAFVTYLAKKGVPTQLIAKITGHKYLDYILHYTQKIQAEDILSNLFSL